MGRFEGKVALITGGGSGLGRASGVRIAAEGGWFTTAEVLAVDGGSAGR